MKQQTQPTEDNTGHSVLSSQLPIWVVDSYWEDIQINWSVDTQKNNNLHYILYNQPHK